MRSRDERGHGSKWQTELEGERAAICRKFYRKDRRFTVVSSKPVCIEISFVSPVVIEANKRTRKYRSSLVNTLPKTKKDKYTAVTEAHKECT